MNVGRKIYFETFTGNVIYPPLETRSGEVKETGKEEDFNNYLHLSKVDLSLCDFIQLGFNEKETEIQNMGSMHIDASTRALIIYPKLNISADNLQITTTQFATITVTTQNNCTVNFQVNDGELVPKNTTNNQAVFTFQSDVPDTYTIKASAELYGTNSVEVTVNA